MKNTNLIIITCIKSSPYISSRASTLKLSQKCINQYAEAVANDIQIFLIMVKIQ